MMHIFFNVKILYIVAFLAYSFYFYEVLAFSNMVLEESKLKKVPQIIVSCINGMLVTIFFVNTIMLPLIVCYFIFTSLISLNFLLFYKDNYFIKLFFVLAYMMHFMCLSSIIMASYASITSQTLYAITYSPITMLHTIILIAVLAASAIAIVRRTIPAVEIKIINRNAVQLYFMIIWTLVFSILMFINANIFSINEKYTILIAMQIIIPVVVLIGLYVVLFFAIQTGKLLGYKAKTAELQEQIAESERKQHELQIKADRDPLTKLYNKEVTALLIEEHINNHKHNTLDALFLIDLDNFKTANDQRGHIFGDELLVEVAKNIINIFRVDDTAGRIGGDEFMVFMKNIQDIETVTLKAQEICRALFISFKNKENTESNISSSVGIALYPQHGKTYSQLYKAADEALYSAKENGKNTYVISK